MPLHGGLSLHGSFARRDEGQHTGVLIQRVGDMHGNPQLRTGRGEGVYHNPPQGTQRASRVGVTGFLLTLDAVVQLGTVPPAGILSTLGLQSIPGEQGEQHQPEAAMATSNPLAAIIPLLTALPGVAESPEMTETKSARYLVAKGLPTLPSKVVENAWNWEYVDMEEFLPAPRSLRIAEMGKPVPSLQESLVGAFSHFQALQHHQKAQRRELDIVTWARCFSLYVAVMAKRRPEMVVGMVTHLHAVLRLHQKAPLNQAWREYDIQFRMEAAASEKTWACGDPWQFITCLPGLGSGMDPFDVSESATPSWSAVDSLQSVLLPRTGTSSPSTPASLGKRPATTTDDLRGLSPQSKRTKKLGLCQLFNRAPGGCPYGDECCFTHRCSNCGVWVKHGRSTCPLPTRPGLALTGPTQ